MLLIFLMEDRVMYVDIVFEFFLNYHLLVNVIRTLSFSDCYLFNQAAMPKDMLCFFLPIKLSRGIVMLQTISSDI